MLFGLHFGDVLIFDIVLLHNNYTCKKTAGSPAVDHNGFVSSPPLYHQHLLNDCHDGRRGGAQTLSGPAGHLELSYLVFLA